jgi:hypothetical protein
MPTAAKLFAAFAFMAIGFLTAEVIKPHMSEGTQFGAFTPISALIGLVCGWRVLGPAAGRGDVQAFGTGVKTSVVMVLLGLLLFGIERMLVNALRRTYDGPMDALVGIVQIAIEYAQVLVAWDIMAVLVVGGGLAGLLTEWAARRWR